MLKFTLYTSDWRETYQNRGYNLEKAAKYNTSKLSFLFQWSQTIRIAFRNFQRARMRKSLGCTPLNHFPILSHAKIRYEKRHLFVLPDIKCSQNINFLQEKCIVHQIKGIWSSHDQLDFSLWWSKVWWPLKSMVSLKITFSRCRTCEVRDKK